MANEVASLSLPIVELAARSLCARADSEEIKTKMCVGRAWGATDLGTHVLPPPFSTAFRQNIHAHTTRKRRHLINQSV